MLTNIQRFYKRFLRDQERRGLLEKFINGFGFEHLIDAVTSDDIKDAHSYVCTTVLFPSS